MGGGPEDPRNGGIQLAALVVLAALLRIPALGAESLWIDELWSAHHVLRPLPEMFRSLVTGDNHPPLFHFAQWLFTRIDDTELFLRLPSAIFGILAVPVAFRVGRRIESREAGLVAAALIALAPFAVHHSREARFYALVLLLTLVAIDTFLSVDRRGRWRDILALGATAAALVLTHYLTAVFLAALGVASALCSRRTFLRTAAAGGVALVLSAAWVPFAAKHFGGVIEIFWHPPPSVGEALHMVAEVVVVGPVEGAFPTALVIVLSLPWLLAGGVAMSPRFRSPDTRTLAVIFLLPLFATFAIGLVRPLFMARALIILLAPAALLVAVAATRLPRPRLAAAVLVATLLPGLPFVVAGRYREDWRGAAATIALEGKDGETVVMDPFLRPGLEYYGPRTPGFPRLEVQNAPAAEAMEEFRPGSDPFWLVVRPDDVRTTGQRPRFLARYGSRTAFEKNNLTVTRLGSGTSLPPPGSGLRRDD